MALLQAFFRAVVVASAIWAGQTALAPANKMGIWAMVSLGIASGLLGLILTRVATRADTRALSAMLEFLGTTVILAVFYLLLPKSLAAWAADFVLAVVVGAVSGLVEWVLPDHSTRVP